MDNFYWSENTLKGSPCPASHPFLLTFSGILKIELL